MANETLMGHDGQLALTGQTWKIHSWQVEIVRPAFDDTGDTATVTQYALGDPTVRGTAQMSLINSSTGKKLPQPYSGTLVVGTFTTLSGYTYVNNLIITQSRWSVEKRGGGPQQRAIIQFVTQDTSAGGFFSPTA